MEDIPSANLIGNVEVHPSVITLTDVELPTSTAHTEYGGSTMSVTKNKQLASSTPWSFNVKPTSTIESVFRLDRDGEGTYGLEDGEFEFIAEPSERYIVILANAETFDEFDNIRSQRNLTLATVYLNALTTAVAALRSEPKRGRTSQWLGCYTEGANEGSRVESIGLAAQRMLGSPLARLTELSQ